MKNHLTGNKPVVASALAGLFLVTCLAGMFFPPLNDALMLYPANVTQPANWYRFLTFPLSSAGGLGTWLYNALLLLFMGNIIEHRMKRQHLLALLLLASCTGGLLYASLYRNPYGYPADLEPGIAGPGMISWGYFTAAAIYTFRNMNAVPTPVRVIMLLLAPLIVVSMTTVSHYSVLAADLGAVAATVLLVTRPGVLMPPTAEELESLA